jgi:predicted transcriptional regulator
MNGSAKKPKQGDRPKGEYIPFRLDPETNAVLSRIAITEHRTKSEIIRRYIDMGIKNSGFRPDDERMGQMIRDAVQEVMKPHVERLASISAKATNIGAASFFLQSFVGRLMFPPSDRERIDEAAENARRLGIEYLKLKKERDPDEFIAAGVAGMKDI